MTSEEFGIDGFVAQSKNVVIAQTGHSWDEGTVETKPECAEAFRALAAPCVEASRKEAGNVSYGLYTGKEDGNKFFFVEVWKDEEDKDYVWWETEYGGSCLYGIDCHPVFSDSPPCLLDERNIPYNNIRKREETCDECKALWLMEKYE